MVTSRGEEAVAAGGREGPATRPPVLPTSPVTDADTQCFCVDSSGHTSSVFIAPMVPVIHAFLKNVLLVLPFHIETLNLV